MAGLVESDVRGFSGGSGGSLNRTGSWRRVGLVTLAAFGLSLCIECLQLVLHVGFFEVTDLVMNTVGGGVGGLVAGRIMRLKERRGGGVGGGEKACSLTPNSVSYETNW